MQLRERVRAAGARSIDEVKFLEVVVLEGFLSVDGIADFISRARQAGLTLPSYAAMARTCPDADLAKIMARVHGLGVIDLNATEVDQDIARKLTPAQSSRLGAIPVGRGERGTIVVAIADPANVAARDELPGILGAAVELRVAPIGQLRDAQNEILRGASAVDSELAEEGEMERDIRVSSATNDSAVVALVNQMIAQAQEDNASDIHIEPTERETIIRFRVDGILIDARHLPSQLHDQLISRVKILADLKIDERRSPQDGRTSVDVGRGKVDLRVATLPTVYGERVSMRMLDPNQVRLGLSDLGLADVNLERVSEAISQPHGLCITTGPTGCGKSTTLYATLNLLNSRSRNIITVEDPVEQRIHGVNQIQTNERANLTFATALRSILRSDPDVIMIGEIRDQETAKIAVESSMTGHLVLSSLHTNSAPAAVNRLMEMGVEPFLISEACRLIMAQRLARVLCPYCKVPFSADAAFLERARAPEWAVEQAREDHFTLHRANPTGCERCRTSGYSGRIGLHEVMPLTHDLKELINRGGSAEEIADLAISEGMQTLRMDGFRKVADGVTSLEEMARVVS